MVKVSTLMEGFPARSNKTIFGITTVLLFQGEKNIIYDVDGEKGTTFPIHVTVEKQSLCVIIPKNLEYEEKL